MKITNWITNKRTDDLEAQTTKQPTRSTFWSAVRKISLVTLPLIVLAACANAYAISREPIDLYTCIRLARKGDVTCVKERCNPCQMGCEGTCELLTSLPADSEVEGSWEGFKWVPQATPSHEAAVCFAEASEKIQQLIYSGTIVVGAAASLAAITLGQGAKEICCLSKN